MCVCVCVWVGGWVGELVFVCVCMCVCGVCVWGGGGSGKEIVEEGETYIQQQLHSERGENEERGKTCRRNHCI